MRHVSRGRGRTHARTRVSQQHAQRRRACGRMLQRCRTADRPMELLIFLTVCATAPVDFFIARKTRSALYLGSQAVWNLFFFGGPRKGHVYRVHTIGVYPCETEMEYSCACLLVQHSLWIWAVSPIVVGVHRCWCHTYYMILHLCEVFQLRDMPGGVAPELTKKTRPTNFIHLYSNLKMMFLVCSDVKMMYLVCSNVRMM